MWYGQVKNNFIERYTHNLKVFCLFTESLNEINFYLTVQPLPPSPLPPSPLPPSPLPPTIFSLDGSSVRSSEKKYHREITWWWLAVYGQVKNNFYRETYPQPESFFIHWMSLDEIKFYLTVQPPPTLPPTIFSLDGSGTVK